MKRIAMVAAAAALLLLIMFVARGRFADPKPMVDGPQPTSGSIESKILGEEREFFVHLPPEYRANRDQRFPVLYVLDGLMQSGHTAQSAALLARVGAAPPMIVVAIPNISRRTRGRDLEPPESWTATATNAGSARFLSFLSEELIPHIEREYRTARPRMLAGWSLGGLFVLYTHGAAPSLFDARFAHSPSFWGADDPKVKQFEASLKTPVSTKSFLYLSMGSLEADDTIVPFRKALTSLQQHAPPTLRWMAEFTEGGDHGSNPRIATPWGIHRFFQTKR